MSAPSRPLVVLDAPSALSTPSGAPAPGHRAAAAGRAPAVRLPQARGPLSAWVLARLGGLHPARPRADAIDGAGEDAQLALYLAYESHYGPLPGTCASLEWDPDLIAVRRRIERAFEHALRSMVPTAPPERGVREALVALVTADSPPSLARHMERRGTMSQMRDIVIRRAPYALKEADGHSFAIPRLRGRAKQLLVQIQSGEYGCGAPDQQTHAALYAQTMRSLGLSDRPNAYLDEQPASSLAVSNLVSMFALNRRWTGALVGHLAAFETTSVTPMARYARGLRRLGAPAEAARFYDVHVVADAEHEWMALDLAAALAADEPVRRGDIVFGAQCALAVDARFAGDLFATWSGSAVTG
jgi:hypothetical protein